MKITIDLDPQATREWTLRYRDATGDLSDWIVLPLSVHGQFDATGFNVFEIDARCAPAGAKRTFRLDGVIEVGDRESSETISAEEWIEALDFEPESRARAIQLYCYFVVLREQENRKEAEKRQGSDRRRRVVACWMIGIAIGTTALIVWSFAHR